MLTSMVTNTALHQATRKPLSCTRCRQRKIKCDKADPCSQCIQSDVECVFPTRRSRASRKKDALEARDSEVLRRIKRLEEMLASKGDARHTEPGDNKPRDPSLVSPNPSRDVVIDNPHTNVALDDQYGAFAEQQGHSSRHLNSEFWSSLTTEFDGLRQLIEGAIDDEDEFDDSEPSPNFMLQCPASFDDSKISYPSDSHTATLIQFYFTNVDPLCKILHRPTANAYFSNIEPLLDPHTRRFKFRSLEAVTFAVYFAAVTSMSSQECLTYLGEERTTLILRYKGFTETAMAQANFLNTLEIIGLQAFTIYIVAQRSLNHARFSWSLIGLAVRLAHGIGLHRDGDGQAFSAFEAEMRRRLWWQILALDMRASEDRGSEPFLSEDSFNTVLPCNINDEDFNFDSQHPLQSKIGPTETSLCLIGYDALWTSYKAHFRPVGSNSNNLSLEEREEVVEKYSERVKSVYLADSNFSDQTSKLLHLMGQLWTHKLWLVLYYSLRPSQKVESRSKGLHTAIKLLTVNELIEQHASTAPFTWLFTTFAPWHAVAVILAELCTQPQGNFADRGWEIIERRFKDWSGRVADAKEAMIWSGPIKNLMKRARISRQQTFVADQDFNAPDLPSNLHEFNAPEISNSGIDGLDASSSFDPQLFDNFGLFNQTGNQDFEGFPFVPMDTTAGLELSGDSNNSENWNEFLFDVNELGGDFNQEPLDFWSTQNGG